MALVLKDRIKETTTTTGTGTYSLAGAEAGFQGFSAVGDGNTCYYACTDGTDFEVGIGTFTASGSTLARTTILESSNSDAAVNWGAGSKDIFVTAPADKIVYEDASGDITITGDVKILDGVSQNTILAGGGYMQYNADTTSTQQFRGHIFQIRGENWLTMADYTSGSDDKITSKKKHIFDVGAEVTGSITVTGDISFEGATNDGYETTVTVADPTADRTITLPDASGTVLLSDGDGSNLTGVQAASVDIDESSDDDVNYNILFSDTSGTGSIQMTPQQDDNGLTFNPSSNRLSVLGTVQSGPYVDSHLHFIGYGADGSTEYVAMGVQTGYASITAGGVGSTSTDLRLRTANSGTEADRVTIKADGKTGIGTTSPSEALDVVGNVDIAGRLKIANGSTSSGYIDLLEDSDNGTNKIKLEAPQTISSDKTITLPDTAGNVGLDTTAGGVLLLSTTISDDASVEFSSSYITSDFRHYIVELSEIVPATNDTRLRMQLGTSNFADTGSNYLWITQSTGVSASDASEFYWTSSSNATHIQVTSSLINEMGTGTGENFNALLKIYNVNSTSAYKTVGSLDSFPSYGEGEYSVATQFLTGTYTNQSAVNYLKFYSSSGNLTSGTAKLWGVR